MPLRHLLFEKPLSIALHSCRLQIQCRASLRSKEEGNQQVNICTNKTCKKQGSVQIAKFVEDLGLPNVVVHRTGCLAHCGSGPNMVLSPLDVTLCHINSVAKMVDVLRSVGGFELPDSVLKATELRIAGNGEARLGRLEQAVKLYNEGLALNPPYGRYLLLSNRSGVLLNLGRLNEAARDADEAASLAPEGFHNAFIRQVEAYAALEDYSTAAKALEEGVRRDPGFASTKEYKSLTKQLSKVLVSR